MEVVSSSSTGLVTQNCPLQSSKEEWCSISPYTFLTLEIYLRKILFINIYKYLLCRKKNMVLFIAVWMYIAHRFWITFYSQDCCYENWIVCVIFFNWDQSKSTCSCQESLHLSLIKYRPDSFLGNNSNYCGWTSWIPTRGYYSDTPVEPLCPNIWNGLWIPLD